MKHPAVNDAILAELGDSAYLQGTQTMLAAAVGVSTSTVSRWINRQASPLANAYPAIEQYLDLPPGTLRTLSQRSIPPTAIEVLEQTVQSLADLRTEVDELRAAVAALQERASPS